MKARHSLRRVARYVALAATTLVIAGCGGSGGGSDPVDGGGGDADVYYYVSLGTSLAVGVQPNSIGVLLTSDDGYPDQLFDLRQAYMKMGSMEPILTRLKNEAGGAGGGGGPWERVAP